MRVRRWSLSLCILVASVSVLAFALAGCSEPQMSAEAEPVSYEPGGSYTTTITPRDGVSMDGLTAADFKIGYPIVDPSWVEEQEAEAQESAEDAAKTDDASETEVDADATDTAVASDSNDAPAEDSSDTAVKAAPDGQGPSTEGSDDEDSSDEDWVDVPSAIVTAEVKDFAVNEDGTATLSFEDPKASENQPEIYSVYAEKSDFSTQVPVDYPTFTLKPDVSQVAATSEATKLTLVLDEGEFNPDVTKDSITLGDSFANMDVESLSSAGANLTLQLTGAPTMSNEAGVFVPGTVGVEPAAIAHASEQTYASIPVEVDGVMPVPSGLEAQDGTVTLPVMAYGVADPARLDPSRVSVTGGETAVTVKDVQSTGEGEVTLTLDVPGASTANAAAKSLDGQTLEVAGLETVIDLPEASFYPVFDYVDESDGDLALTLIAYANGGTIAEGLAAEDVTLSGGFGDGRVTSVERTGDTTAKIELSIPAGDQTPETLDVTGTVTLAAGALVSSWGEPTDGASSCTRSYSQASLGREVNLTDVLKMVENSGFVSALNTASAISGGYEAVTNLLTACGVLQDANQQVLEELKSIESTLDDVQRTLATQSGVMKDIQKGQYEDRCNGFESAIFRLADDNQTMGDYFAKVGTLDVPAPAVPGTAPEAADGSPAGPDDAQSWARYLTDLIEAMRSAEANGDGNFAGFSATMADLEADYRTVANAVGAASDSNNALYNYDYLCSLTYNFDTIARPYREAFRANVVYQLDRALAFLRANYNSILYPDSAKVNQVNRAYDTAMAQLGQRPVQVADGTIYFYTIGVKVDRDIRARYQEFSDLDDTQAVVGWGNLDAAQRDDFVKRMHGRTAREEFELAGFEMTQTGSSETNDYYGPLTGIGLNFYKKFVKRGAFRYDYDYNYADYIRWNHTYVEQTTRSKYQYSGGNIFLDEEGWVFRTVGTAAFRYVK